MRITLPGNLLLLGEYAVTRPEGLGIALALDNARLIVDVKPSHHLTLTSIFQGKTHSWREGEEVPPELVLPLSLLLGIHDLEISIDSSSFSDPSGRKRGFGSSGALCAALSYLKLKYELQREPDLGLEVFPHALRAHRKFQGGRGSGYDVLVSLLGGTLLFIGGELPSWSSLPEFSSFYILQGDAPVQTGGAIRRFEEFLSREPKKSADYIEQSNRLVQNFIATPSSELFNEASQLNQWLGDQIGVIAEGPKLHAALEKYRSLGLPCKSLGSGGELAVVYGEGLSLEKVKVGKGLECRE